MYILVLSEQVLQLQGMEKLLLERMLVRKELRLTAMQEKVLVQLVKCSISQSIAQLVMNGNAMQGILPGQESGGKVEGGREQTRPAGDYPWLLLLPVARPPPAKTDGGLEEGRQGELFATGAEEARHGVGLALFHIF